MRSEPTELLFTYDDLQDVAIRRGYQYEILDGELVVTPAPFPWHQFVLLELYDVVKAHVRAKNLGFVLLSPTDLHLSKTDVLQPDMLFVSSARERFIEEKFVSGPPDLVVEVLSKGTTRRDRVTKREIYERFAVPNYWIVDPFSEKVEELVRRGKRLVLRGTMKGNKTFAPACFPGLKIPLKKLWSV